MSLTKHLARGPVREWFLRRLPNTRAVAQAANVELRRGAPSTAPAIIPAVDGSDRGLVGHAAEYVLRAHLAANPVEHTAATGGADRLDRRRRINGTASLAERAAVERINALAPWSRELSASEWQELLRAAVVLGRLEQYLRASDQVWDAVAKPLIEAGPALDELSVAMAGEPTYTDLDAVARVAVEDHAELKAARNLTLGPAFTQSLMLGGADADLVADGLLLDFKAKATGDIAGRFELWQLVGYLLADTWDEHRIRSLGLAALRWRATVTWEARNLLEQLSGEGQTLEAWRAEFADLLVDLAISAGRRVVLVGRPPELGAASE